MSAALWQISAPGGIVYNVVADKVEPVQGGTAFLFLEPVGLVGVAPPGAVLIAVKQIEAPAAEPVVSPEPVAPPPSRPKRVRKPAAKKIVAKKAKSA